MNRISLWNRWQSFLVPGPESGNEIKRGSALRKKSPNKPFPPMERYLIRLLIAVAILVQAMSAFANDTLARVGAGGIEFVKSHEIQMLEEVLEISEKVIRVKYRFLNEFDTDIHTTVAFPLPPCNCFSPMVWPEGYQRLERTFNVRVNGHPIKTKTARKAVIDGRDVTDKLRSVGFSDKQIFDNCYGSSADSPLDFDTLTQAQKTLLEKLRGEKKKWLGWDVAVTIYWQQTFPAGKEIAVEHEYVPFAGGTHRSYEKAEPGSGVSDFVSYISKSDVCLDEHGRQGLVNQVKARATKDNGIAYLTVNDIGYILGTGGNWRGPIGEFTLRIKKDNPNQIVSLCFAGKPEKVSPTVYEFHQKDYNPEDKLIVYFYTVGPDVHN
jgi:hypothetical protein